MATLTTISPITSKPIIETPATTFEQLTSDILPKSVAAQKQWFKNTTLADRKKVIAKFVELITAEPTISELAKGITEQMGRPIRYTPGELTTAALRANTLLGFADDALVPVNAGESGPNNKTIDFEGQFKKYLSHDPLGVVLIIFPWNYPYLCLINALVPALLVGNSVLIKPSPQTPKVAHAVVKYLKEAGLPDGVVQEIHSGDNELIEKLIQRKEIAAVAFTGSVAGGLAVQKAASNRTIPIALELGGNDAAYVRADSDVKFAAENIVDGAIFNSGQSCCAIERVYVDASIYDEFVESVVAEVKGYKVGDPFDKDTQIGPVVSEKSAQAIRAQIAEAVSKGAKALIPEGFFAEAEKTNPTFVGPQVLVDLAPDSAVLQEETFGPVIPIVKVNSDEEAIKLINDSDFGLTASVWTKDLAKGEELGDEIEAGTVFVNRADYPDPSLAWTGYKNSGRAVSLSKFGFDFYGKLKSHHIKRV